MKSREHYSLEFRADAVRLVLEQGLSQAEAARRLSIAKGTLANWVVAVKGRQEKTVPGGRSVTELEGEDEGWLYLAGLKDMFTCEIVGYEMGERMTTGLVSQALFRAVQQKRPPAGLISRQYCAKAYRALQHADLHVT